MKRIQEELVNHGVRKVIRITKNAISAMQLNRTARELNAYKALEVSSMEEALEYIRKDQEQ